MVTKEQVREKLKEVLDPEMGVNVVDLGLIYEVRIQESEARSQNSEDLDSGQARMTDQLETLKPGNVETNVHILMTLTSPGCPLAYVFDDLIGGAVRQIEGVSKCTIELTFDPPWNMSKMSEEARAELGFL